MSETVTFTAVTTVIFTSDPVITETSAFIPVDSSTPSLPANTTSVSSSPSTSLSTDTLGTAVLTAVFVSHEPTSSTLPVKSEPTSRTAAIVGGAVGGAVGGISLLCLVLVCVSWYRRHRLNFFAKQIGDVSTYTLPSGKSRNAKGGKPGNRPWNGRSTGQDSATEMPHSGRLAETSSASPPPGHPGLPASSGAIDTSSSPLSLPSEVLAQREGQITHMRDEMNVPLSTQPQETVPGVQGPNSMAPAMSLMMQEMEILRARLAQFEQRQPRESHSLSYVASDIDGDDRQTAPPAYSDDGRS